MSDTASGGGSPAPELQFDHAEYATPTSTAACKMCGQPLVDVYYEVNGQPFCQGCHEQLQKALSSGSAFGRMVRATLYGSLAGLAGAAIYYGVREATNIEFGLISIVVGLMIGKAVKKGCNARGGWFYQALAIFLTYTAIVLTYIPPMVKAISDRAAKQAAAAKPEQPAQPAQAADAAGDVGARPHVSISEVLVALAFLLGFAYAVPILIGFHSPMSLLIVGIGLYEAWVINRRIPLIMNGPFQLGRADAGGAAHVEPAG
jgi:hypothetical protein